MDPELHYRYYGKNPSYAPDHFAIGGFTTGGFVTARTADRASTDVNRTHPVPLDDLLINKQPAIVIGTSTPGARRSASTVSRDLEHLFSQTYADVGGFDSDDLFSNDSDDGGLDPRPLGDDSDNYLGGDSDDADADNYLGGDADDVDDVCNCDHALGNESDDPIESANGSAIEFANEFAIGADNTADNTANDSEHSHAGGGSLPDDSLTSLFVHAPCAGDTDESPDALSDLLTD